MSFHYQPVPFGTVGILHNQPVSFGTCVSLDSCFPCTFVLLFSVCCSSVFSYSITFAKTFATCSHQLSINSEPAYCATGKSSQ